MQVCSIVKTITQMCCGRPDSLVIAALGNFNRHEITVLLPSEIDEDTKQYKNDKLYLRS